MIIKILKKNDLTPIIKEQITELYKHLNASITQLSIQDVLNDISGTTITICTDNEKVIGLAMIAKYKVISGYKGMIEDVVVHTEYRGKGIGRKLMLKLLEESKYLGLTDVLLFSGHHRTPAISLYKSLGFTLKNSGLYTLKIE